MIFFLCNFSEFSNHFLSPWIEEQPWPLLFTLIIDLSIILYCLSHFHMLLSSLLDMHYGLVLFDFLQLCEVGRGDVSLYTFNRWKIMWYTQIMQVSQQSVTKFSFYKRFYCFSEFLSCPLPLKKHLIFTNAFKDFQF